MSVIGVNDIEDSVRCTYQPIVELRGITKRYGATCANDEVNLSVASGEIIGLVGGNGAGKSTLMRIMGGETKPDNGTIKVFEKSMAESQYDASVAQKLGIRTVHQELTLCGNLTVCENFYLEAPEGMHINPGWRKHYRKRAHEALESVFPNSGIDVDAQVSRLSISARQMVEIARALAAPGIRVAILDEPTSSLTLNRSQQLQRYIQRRAAGGTAFVFISHKLQEVSDLVTRIVVMRNADVAWTGETKDASINDMVYLMGGVGIKDEEVDSDEHKKQQKIASSEALLDLSGIWLSLELDEIKLSSGEIVGLAGLEGSGQRELLHEILSPSARSGVKLKSGASATFISGDRQAEGVFPLWSVLDNVLITRIASRATFSLVRTAREAGFIRPLTERIGLDPKRLPENILTLSGGNQQKALVARALASDAPIILLDDPTRGVDINAKKDFYYAVNKIAREGRLVIWYSSEDKEFLECDRVLVFSEGVIQRELIDEDVDEKSIVDASFDSKENAYGKIEDRGAQTGYGYGGKLAKTGASIAALVNFELIAPFVSLGVVLLVMGLANPLSLTSFGLTLLLMPAVSLVLVAFGQMFIIGGSEIDLGAGPFAGVVNVLSATLLVNSPALGVLALLGILLAYASLGPLIQLRKIPAIVVTLGASFIWLGIGLTIQPSPGGSSPEWLSSLFAITFPIVPTPVVYLLIAGFVGWAVNRTPTGVVLRAFGNNPTALAASGWSPVRYATIRYFIAGFFILMAGLSMTGINTSSDIHSGTSYTLLAVAGVVIGGCHLFGGLIYPIGALVGAVTLSLIGALLSMVNVNSNYSIAVQGALLLLVLIIQGLVARHGESK